MSEYLIKYKPDWFELTKETPDFFLGTFFPVDTDWVETGVDLKISRDISVQELTPGTLFPKICFDRHIESDSSFCLRLKNLEVVNKATAEKWWDELRQYVECQFVANETGVWPAQHNLDHGVAGYFHEEAIHLANKLGIFELYLEVQSGRDKSVKLPSISKFKGKNLQRFRRLLKLEGARKSAQIEFCMKLYGQGYRCCGYLRRCSFKDALV